MGSPSGRGADDELRARLDALSRRMDSMEEDRESDGALLSQIAAKLGVTLLPDDGDEQNRDHAVLCPKCKSKVGYYDPGTDLIRTRHREHLVMARMGPGGSVTIVCRKCSFPVEVTYCPPGTVQDVEVREGLLVLDALQIAALLQGAMDSGSGQVTLRLRAS